MRRVLPTLIAIALPVSLMTATAGSAQALPSVCRQTLSGQSFTSPAQNVPTEGSSDLSVTAPGHVGAIAVTVSASEYDSADANGRLLLTNTGSGKTVELASIPNLSTLSRVTFDDAATAVYDGGAAGPGSFKPASPLGAFTGVSVAGTWKLAFDNSVGISDVMVPSWSITVTYANCVVKSRLGIARHKRSLHGKVASSTPFCKVARSVTVYRVRAGHKKVLGQTITSAKGAWHFKAKKKSHVKYFAKVAARGMTGTYCGGATSRRVR